MTCLNDQIYVIYNLCFLEDFSHFIPMLSRTSLQSNKRRLSSLQTISGLLINVYQVMGISASY